MTKKLALLNSASVILVITINYLSQALRFNDTTIGEMSANYQNLFTPASYAFSIWGLIFFGLIAYCIFQLKKAFSVNKDDNFIKQTGYWFTITNVLNCLWLFAFIYDFTGLSVMIMFGILFSLIKIILRTNMERWDAPLSIIAFVWWPICIYAGWISVAAIANIASYLTKIDWDGGFLSEASWTIVMILVATAINILVLLKRNMREFALVGVWALVAIFIRHQDSNIKIAYLALVSAVIVFSISAWHGYQNRATNPIKKLMNRN